MKKLDTNDIIYYFGLILLFLGMTIAFSIGHALIATGGILVLISVINSFVRVWLSQREERHAD